MHASGVESLEIPATGAKTRAMSRALFIALLVLAACQHETPPVEETPPLEESVALEEAESGEAEGTGKTTFGGFVEREPDLCDAETMQDAVGKLYAEVDTSGVKRVIRVIRPGEIFTQEYNPQRMNFYLNGTETVTEVKCG